MSPTAVRVYYLNWDDDGRFLRLKSVICDDDDNDDHDDSDGDLVDQELAWKQAVPPYYRESLCCELPPTRSRSIPYFEFSPQMSRMIRANIGCRRPGLGYPTPDWEGRWSNRWHCGCGRIRVDVTSTLPEYHHLGTQSNIMSQNQSTIFSFGNFETDSINCRAAGRRCWVVRIVDPSLCFDYLHFSFWDCWFAYWN